MSELRSQISFKELFDMHQCVQVPMIQRDYAQGRLTERIKQIREKFVLELCSAIKENGKPVHLDFVYGRIQGKDNETILRKNKEAIRNVLYAV